MAVLFSAPVCVWYCWLLTVIQFSILIIQLVSHKAVASSLLWNWHFIPLGCLCSRALCSTVHCSFFLLFPFFFVSMTVTSFFFFLKKTHMSSPFFSRHKTVWSFTDSKVYISLLLLFYLYKHFTQATAASYSKAFCYPGHCSPLAKEASAAVLCYRGCK